MSVASKQVIVVGTGLAGLSTTHHLLSHGINVVLLEKTPVVGMASNSNKASSGINGVLTEQQIALNINDSIEEFVQDSLKSAKSSARPDLISSLTHRSKAAIDWLTDTFDIDLSRVSQLGGHSKPRTHRGSGALPPGYAIVSALLKSLNRYENLKQLQILKNSRVTQLLRENNKIVGVTYEDSNSTPPKIIKLLADDVVLATGGYSADFTNENSLIAKYRSDLINLPSTNGQQTTGDGIKLLVSIGADLVDMDKIQIHPTGFVDPTDPGNRWKFLAGEVLRGNGGILLNDRGERFTNELNTRDAVTKAIYDTKSKDDQVILLIPNGCFQDLQTHIEFYMSKKLMVKSTLKELSQARNIPLTTLITQISSYNTHSNKDQFLRQSFGPKFATEEGSIVYYGIVTPVLHFSMGGLKIDDNTRVIDTGNQVIEGLYAVGEVSGGVHGYNRLGGSSLLECVVFGTVASEVIVERRSTQLDR